MSPLDHPCPPETSSISPETSLEPPMNAHFDPKHVINPFAAPIQQTLADVLAAVLASNLSQVQKRDQASAVKRIGELCRKDLGDVLADIAALRDLVQRLDPTAVDFKPKPISHKTW